MSNLFSHIESSKIVYKGDGTIHVNGATTDIVLDELEDDVDNEVTFKINFTK